MAPMGWDEGGGVSRAAGTVMVDAVGVRVVEETPSQWQARGASQGVGDECALTLKRGFVGAGEGVVGRGGGGARRKGAVQNRARTCTCVIALARAFLRLGQYRNL